MQYRFAYDKHSNSVDVKTLAKDSTRQGYTCIGCGGKMLARLGSIKVWHFADHPGFEGVCSGETYLHKNAKEMFARAFLACRKDSQPFSVPRLVTTTEEYLWGGRTYQTVTSVTDVPVDLCRFYDQVQVEQREGSFVPDLSLHDSSGRKKPLHIEIFVTHGVSEAKRTSGNQIIEVTVRNEDDLYMIALASLSNFLVEWIGFDDERLVQSVKKPPPMRSGWARKRVNDTEVYVRGKSASNDDATIKPFPDIPDDALRAAIKGNPGLAHVALINPDFARWLIEAEVRSDENDNARTQTSKPPDGDGGLF